MRLLETFIRRPVLAIVVNLILLLLGIASIYRLNVRQYPKSDVSVVTVTTPYIGASADLVRGFITTPLERVISSVDGIDYLESTSADGLSTIRAHLELNYDPNIALTQVTAKINQVKGDLPPESEEPVLNVETPDNQVASMYLGFSSTQMKANEVTDYLVRVVQPRLSSIEGVQRADVLGARTFAMRIWLKRERMAAFGISPEQVYAALASQNTLSAVGQTKSEMIRVSLKANTDLETAEEFQQIVVREDGGAIIRLSDIADVELGSENYDDDIKFDGQPAKFMGIWVLPTANSLDVIGRVRAALPGIEADLPPSLEMGVPYDATRYIENAIKEIVKTLSETLGIVVIVIFLFLGSVRSVLIPAVAMPLSLIGGMFMMFLFGFTLNLLTLLAIVLAVGIVVDDAIVMVENVERHIRMGKGRIRAAVDAMRELVGPIIAMTLTLVSVYAPIGFQGGLTGALFREFAFTLAGAVLISGFVALTLSPVMSSRLLPKRPTEKGVSAVIGRTFEKVSAVYGRMLAQTLRNSPVINTMAVLFILIVPLLFLFSQKELAPVEDQGVIFGIINGSPSATLEQTLLYSEQIGEIYRSLDVTANTFEITFPGGGFSGMVTKPWSERDRTTAEILPEVQGKIGQIAGLEVFVTTPPPLPGGSNFPVEFIIKSTADPEEIFEVAEQVVAEANQSGKFMFAFSDLKFDRPQTEVVVNRDLAAKLGIDMRSLAGSMGAALGGGYVNRFSIDGRSYKVIPQLRRMERLTPEQLKDIHVQSRSGELVPLSTLVTLETTAQPRSLTRFEQQNSVRISGSPIPGTTIGDALTYLEESARSKFPEGRGFGFDFAGESRQLKTEGNAAFQVMGFALIFIFLVLAAQFESFRDPFIILLGSVPLALMGALIFSFLGFTTINIYSQVGLVTLVGLVSKNGILIVEFANQLQRQGKTKLEAAREAAITRFRPILMTTAATVFGHMPLVFVTGPGAAARNSIGLILITGMTIGTMFTLFVVPSIYLLLARDFRKNPELADDAEEVGDTVDMDAVAAG